MGKEKKEKRKSEDGDESEGKGSKTLWEEKIRFLCPIAQPLASRKLTKRLYKVVKKASKHKQLRKGVREVQKFVRKGERGILLLAGDVSPVDVISHMPVVCEENNIPYCYTPSKDDLGAACGSKRQTCMLLIKPHDDYRDSYDECFEAVKGIPMPI
ncbi:hypothetical protein CHS0354_014655 [Potamilus streckersoni]|uniref:H/ACA ribonucleoprotein complex subunit 2 n=1 Tax=Potamilus streckersoni TaxID=2493646 RepID=A0AAE0SPP0_9BIVA|nr:hypothetical protein CHS0354_014655 [Potamilus streckersoni]